MKYKAWDLYWAEVRYAETEEVKTRPVVIKDDGAVFVMAFYTTSQSPKPGYDCYNIQKWKEAGLDRPSNIRLHPVLRLDPASIKDRIGRLSELDIAFIGLQLARIANRA